MTSKQVVVSSYTNMNSSVNEVYLKHLLNNKHVSVIEQCVHPDYGYVYDIHIRTEDGVVSVSIYAHNIELKDMNPDYIYIFPMGMCRGTYETTSNNIEQLHLYKLNNMSNAVLVAFTNHTDRTTNTPSICVDNIRCHDVGDVVLRNIVSKVTGKDNVALA